MVLILKFLKDQIYTMLYVKYISIFLNKYFILGNKKRLYGTWFY